VIYKKEEFQAGLFCLEFFLPFENNDNRIGNMKQTNRFWKFVFAALLITLIIIGTILFFFFKALNADQAIIVISIVNDYPIYLLSVFLILVFVGFTGLEIIYQTYIKPVKKISAEAFMIYSSNPSHRLKIKGVKDIKSLSEVINDFADLFEGLNKNITEQILGARKAIEKEKNLLASIMAELPQGVIICNTKGRILLFNSIAKKTFTQGASLKSAKHFIGLGRSIFHLIDKELLTHAIDEIEDGLADNKQSVGSYFITPILTGHIISIETIPMLDTEKQMTGFILIFQDVTNRINQYDITYKHLNSLKKHLDNKEVIHKYNEMSEVILDSIITHLPLTKLLLPYLVKTIQLRAKSLHGIDIIFENRISGGRILADTYSFSAAFVFLIKSLSDITRTTEYTLLSFSDQKFIVFEITWPGEPITENQLEDILATRINALPNLFYVLKQNKSSININPDNEGKCSKISIIVNAELKTPLKSRHRAPVIAVSRPEFYDFDLFKTDDDTLNLLDTRLDKITYTVFDTETTGLNPDGGDEIVSIAAIRIVNNRIVYQDIFEELIDPQRDIPIESYKIHGINYEMVAGKKSIIEILPVFKQFVSDTVLLGHNIAFDMKMLKVKEKSTGIQFFNPVLDTLLMSAVLHPIHEQHDMENIARRLGVNIIGRHTALGDTIATAEIFLKLLPILKSNGILTLKDAIAASKRTYYARLKY
jgi:DNA polymerase III subunit epsilon